VRSKYLLIPFALAIVVLIVEAVGLLPSGNTEVSGPRAEFPGGDTFDFGSVKQGEWTTHEFSIHNAGDEPLKIFDVQTGCGCSSAEVTKDELAPGEQAKVVVRYEGRPVQSQELIQARVVTNQVGDAVHIMQMTGYVRRGLVASGICTASAPSLSELAGLVAASEKRLLNVEVEGVMSLDIRPAGSSGPWERSPVLERAHWWFNGSIGSKARVDRYQILPWTGGDAPFVHIRESVGFDGAFSTRLEHEFGTSDNAMREVHGGQIISGRFGTLVDTRGSGMQFSIYFAEASSGNSFSDELLAAIKNNVDCRVYDEPKNGRASVKVESTFSSDTLTVKVRHWLDPDRGYAIVGQETVSTNKSDGKFVYRKTMDIEELTEAAPGVWYPTKATLIAPNKERGVEERYTYTASKVIANNPDFDESIYRVHIPDGYTIVDKVMGIRYRTGTPPQGLEPYLQESAVNAYGEPVRKLADSPIDLVSDAAPDAFAAQRRRPLLWLAGILAIIAAVLAWRHHKKGASA